MSIQKIVDYVMHTPHNANPAILKQVINDNISWNDLKNKPFGTETETFTLLENGRVSSVGANEGNPTGFPVERVFAIGDAVNIVWNGKEYTGTVQDFDGDIGVSVYPEDSGEDGIYICIYDDGGQPYCVVYSHVSGTLSVTVTREIVHAIDPKYLPCDGVIESNNIPVYTTADNITLVEFDFAAIKEKFLSGKEVSVMFHAVFNYGNNYEVWVKSVGISYNSDKDVLAILFHTPHNHSASAGGSRNVTICVDSVGQVVEVYEG